MNLYVIRHGETDYNVEGRYCGSTDISLNNTGREQAQIIAKELENINFDVIVSSPLKRAIETANIVKVYHTTTPMEIVNEFAERCIGVYEGLTKAEAQNQYPEMWARQCTIQMDDAPLNGETIRQADQRVRKGLNILKEKYSDKTVLVVCHGYISRNINMIIKKLSLEQMRSFTLKNCEVVSYIY